MSGRSHSQRWAGAPGSYPARPRGGVGRNPVSCQYLRPELRAFCQLSLPSAECKGELGSRGQVLRRWECGPVAFLRRETWGLCTEGGRGSESTHRGSSSFSSSAWHWGDQKSASYIAANVSSHCGFPNRPKKSH